jgi:hypothetical protein
MTKACYRNNQAARERAIQQAKEYTKRADPLRRRRIYLSKRVYALRGYIENHLEKIRLLERKLIRYSGQLEKLKIEIRRSGRRACPNQ